MRARALHRTPTEISISSLGRVIQIYPRSMNGAVLGETAKRVLLDTDTVRHIEHLADLVVIDQFHS